MTIQKVKLVNDIDSSNTIMKENFLSPLFFQSLKEIVEAETFGWFFRSHNARPEAFYQWNMEINDNIKLDNHYMFTHILYNNPLDDNFNKNQGKLSPFFEKFEPILYFLEKETSISKLIRMKLNLYPNQNKRIELSKHYDVFDAHKNKPTDNITNAIFNFTTCNGGTVINDEEYESKENSIIIFNNDSLHHGIVQTDTQRRIVLNIAFFN